MVIIENLSQDEARPEDNLDPALSEYDRALLHYQRAQILERGLEYGLAIVEYRKAASGIEDRQQDGDSQMLLEAASERLTRLSQMVEDIWGKDWSVPKSFDVPTLEFGLDPYHQDETPSSGTSDTAETTDV